MQTRFTVLALTLIALAASGCKTSQPDAAYQAHYTTTPPPGAVILPAAPATAAPAQSAQPPLASPMPSRLPD